MAIKTPTKLQKPHLVSVSFELRFDADEVYSDLFALNLANALADGNEKDVFQLPAMQLPSMVRGNDPGFRYMPLLGVKSGNAILQVGPRVLVVASDSYPGWETFRAIVGNALSRSENLRKKSERIGLRFVNFFEGENVEGDLNAEVRNGVDLERSSCNFSLVYREGRCLSRFSFANDAKLSMPGEQEKTGSLIDVDSFFDGDSEDIRATADGLHDLGKKVFFGSLKRNFIDAMEPVYDDD